VGDSLKIWVQAAGGVSNDRKGMHHRCSGDYTKRQVVIVNRRGHGRIVPLIEFIFMAALLKNFGKQILA
jgi:hypothetical protein